MTGDYPHLAALFARGVAPPDDPERAFDRMMTRLLDSFTPRE
ncbi:hypothetical protein [Streptomyces bullii]|uniref:TetR family transcriptional regulator n=1 Tax=Streptomyces bullii TaxID=349910 RepID=A0ABW0UX90_9ACTN